MQTDEKDLAAYDCVNRPEIHFTPAYGWLNDPNGLVKYVSPVTGETVWHMFFQYDPISKSSGRRAWGHAVSRDLLHWSHLPAVLAPDMP